jgi:ferredoxin--NADP+ reductase
MDKEYNSVITQIVQVSPIMKIIRVKPEGWELPEFTAGQFVALGLSEEVPRCEEATEEFKPPKPGKLIRRAYSIASSSSQDFVEFYITLVHSGSLTPRIFTLKIGDKIYMAPKPTGMFTLDMVNEEKNIILVATGTGVAPYMSMLRSNALKRKGNLMVIQGASNSWDLGYSSELQLLSTMFENFAYYPTITMPEKEPAGWSGDTRWIEEIWKDDIVEKTFGFKPTPENTHVFLCGNPNMIKSMEELLVEDGFVKHKTKEPGQIHIEEFF